MAEPGYASAAPLYWNSGFRGVLPLPQGQKTPPPEGRTGYKGLWPEWSDISAWSEESPTGNLGLRLPNTVVGIDVDAYGDKKGAACLEEAESRFGTLPGTVRSTSRLDGISGIRLFKIPAGVELQTVVNFPDKGLDGIEVCQMFHRYVVAWPSVHPSTNRVYRWIDEKGNVLSDVPHVGSLPDLPQTWIDGLKRTPAQQIDTTADVNNVLNSLPSGPMSLQVQTRMAKALLEIENGHGGRHDIALKETLALLRLAERGEGGVTEALDLVGQAFIFAVVNDESRSFEQAQAEWERIVQGQRGHDLIASSPTPPSLADMLGKPAVQAPVINEVTEGFPEESSSLVGKKGGVVLELNHDYIPNEFDATLFSGFQEEGTTESRTSWSPVDLNSILDGDLTPEEPSVLTRDDGKTLLYAGRINALVGPSEGGKSWIALLACVEEMLLGHNVVFLDFEDTPHNVVGRLLSMGLNKETLRSHFEYVGPDTPMGPIEKEELYGLLDKTRPSVIVLDGVNAAMSLIGLDLEKNKEATQFHQWILKPLAVTGATVIIVDHVTKDVATRGPYAIGAQAKRAMIDGTMLGVNAVERFGRGRFGKLEITVLKDKPGGVRAIAEKRGKAGIDYIATALIDAREEGKVKMRLVFESTSESLDTDPDPEVQLRVKMYEVSQYLQQNDRVKKGVGRTKLIEGVGGGYKDVREALDILVDSGHIVAQEGKKMYGKVAQTYILERPFTLDGQAVHDLMGEENF